MNSAEPDCPVRRKVTSSGLATAREGTMSEADGVLIERDGSITIVSINRSHSDLSEDEANEMIGGLAVIASGETLAGAQRFASGTGRHGTFGHDMNTHR
jgi:hypothetical protein